MAEILTENKDIQCANCGYTGPPAEGWFNPTTEKYTLHCPKCGSKDLVEPKRRGNG